MSKKYFPPYSNRTGVAYVSIIILCFIIQSFFIMHYCNTEWIRSTLLQLGSVMGGAFAFSFSIGYILTTQSDDIRPRSMPLFSNELLGYVFLFVLSIILPFLTRSIIITDELFTTLSITSFNLSLFCLAYIPMAYEKIRTRYYPRDVLEYLKDLAINNIKSSEDYTLSWHQIIDITRICNKIYDDDVDLFAGGIRILIAIMNKGIELYEKRKIITLNRKKIPIEEWIRLMRTRIIWIGEKVVENRLAFERVIVAVIHAVQNDDVIFVICNYLCRYARKKGQEESLEIGLLHFIPWCKDHNLYDRCKDLEGA